MKKILTLCLLAVTMCTVAQEQTQEKLIAILETVDKTDKVDYAYELQLRQSLTFAINRTPGYKGYSRLDMAQINSEHNFQRTGFVSDDDIKKLGDMAGAAYVLIAEITPYNGGKLMILANLVNVESGEYENTTPPITSAMDDASMAEACKKIAQILLNVSSNVSSNNHNTQSAEEMYQIGVNYYNGENNYTQDYSQALYWFRKAAEQGYAEAQHALGVCYSNGLGVSQDNSQAVYWFRKAAELENAVAQYALGFCYYNGQGVSQDNSQAVYWFRKAAELENADAQYALGFCYGNGYGVNQNYSQAVYWYRKAAEQGHASAQSDLGICYYHGQGVTQDYSQAVYWFRQAAEQGIAETQYNLGVCYERGQGVQQDYSQAVYWYRKAAEQGYASAQYNLGICYYNGYGVAQNKQTSLYWMKLSANQDDKYAIKFIQDNF